MKKEKIEELFIANAAFSYCGAEMMDIDDFTQVINQAESEWYKELEKKLDDINFIQDLREYQMQIQHKIKELKNGHSQDR